MLSKSTQYPSFDRQKGACLGTVGVIVLLLLSCSLFSPRGKAPTEAEPTHAATIEPSGVSETPLYNETPPIPMLSPTTVIGVGLPLHTGPPGAPVRLVFIHHRREKIG